MLANQFVPPKMSVDEYLLFEEQSEERHEYYDGEVVHMAGTTLAHNRLVRRIANLIEGQSPSRCGIFTESIKTSVSSTKYVYPDVVMTCHPFDLQGDSLIIRSPCLIVEVLSKSTASTDRGIKWRQYRKMPSLWYYVLVEQYTMAVDVFSRVEQTDVWIQETFEEPNDVIAFARLNLELRVGAIYDQIDFTAEDAPAELESTE